METPRRFLRAIRKKGYEALQVARGFFFIPGEWTPSKSDYETDFQNLSSISEQHLAGASESFDEESPEDFEECRRSFSEITPTKDISFDWQSCIPQQSNWRLEDFERKLVLGEGGGGKVFLAREKSSSYILSLKRVNKWKSHSKASILREIHTQISLNHPNITKIFKVFQDKEYVWIAMEWLPDGSLYSLMKECGGSLPEEFVKSFVIPQIIPAVEYMHEQGFLHRDIKPENILRAGQLLKLSDFGSAAMFRKLDQTETESVGQDHEDVSRSPNQKSPNGMGEILGRTTFCGTEGYIPPEMMTGELYDTSCDVWCLGTLIYELIKGRPPFDRNLRTSFHIVSEIPDPDYSGLSEELISLLKEVFVWPELRISLAGIKKHGWLHDT